MSISTLRTRLAQSLLEFAWDEWAQMGILAAAPAPRRWAEDPEALLLLTFEVAREDPRLFDEVLDWLVRNESLISTRRLRSLCEDAEDRRLSQAVMHWVTRQLRPNSPSPPASADDDALEPLFRADDLPTLRADPVFESYGLIRPPARTSGKSQEPDVRAPINFAFRLRHLLGVGTRAEAVRYLLTAEIDAATVADIAASSGYAKRNIHEALSALHTAGVATGVASGGEQRFSIDRSRWAFLLGLDVKDLPVYRDWPSLLGALRQTLRWLMRPDLDGLSDYLRASQAADLLDEVRPRLNRAGILLPARRGGEAAWSDLEDTIDTALAWLAPPRASASPTRFEIVENQDERFGWRLTSHDGRIVANSVESYPSPAAVRAAVKRLQAVPATFATRVTGDSGVFRWNIVAENGRILGVSSELFATANDAHRAGRDARELILGAAGPSQTSTAIDDTRRHVTLQPDGRWRVALEGATHAASTHATQSEAIRAARRSASDADESTTVVVHGRDGRIRRSETVGGTNRQHRAR